VITVNSCGMSLAGTVTVAANVETSVGIARVQFQLDVVNFGPALTAAPFTFTWDTSAVSTGCHLITALPTDVLDNQSDASVSASLNHNLGDILCYCNGIDSH